MSTTKQERDLIRIRSSRKPRRYTTKLQRTHWQPGKDPSLQDAMDEWAEDYSGEHDLFI